MQNTEEQTTTPSSPEALHMVEESSDENKSQVSEDNKVAEKILQELEVTQDYCLNEFVSCPMNKLVLAPSGVDTAKISSYLQEKSSSELLCVNMDEHFQFKQAEGHDMKIKCLLAILGCMQELEQ